MNGWMFGWWQATPFLVGHGDADPVVLYDWGSRSVDKVILLIYCSFFCAFAYANKVVLLGY